MKFKEIRIKNRMTAESAMLAGFTLSILTGVVFVLFYFYQCIQIRPVLNLKEEMIHIKKGESVDPSKYVTEYSSEKGTLRLPPYRKYENEGTYALVYILQDEDTEIFRTLLVKVE